MLLRDVEYKLCIQELEKYLVPCCSIPLFLELIMSINVDVELDIKDDRWTIRTNESQMISIQSKQYNNKLHGEVKIKLLEYHMEGRFINGVLEKEFYMFNSKTNEITIGCFHNGFPSCVWKKYYIPQCLRFDHNLMSILGTSENITTFGTEIERTNYYLTNKLNNIKVNYSISNSSKQVSPRYENKKIYYTDDFILIQEGRFHADTEEYFVDKVIVYCTNYSEITIVRYQDKIVSAFFWIHHLIEKALFDYKDRLLVWNFDDKEVYRKFIREAKIIETFSKGGVIDVVKSYETTQNILQKINF